MEERKQIRLPEVCRCGKMHDTEAKNPDIAFREFRRAVAHACYHDGGLTPMTSPFGEVGICAQCATGFRLNMGYPDSDVMYFCQVCFFPSAEEFAVGTICPCCGTEYDSSDKGWHDFKEERLRWIAAGKYRPKFSDKSKEPPHWNPWLQLAMSCYHEGVRQSMVVSRQKMEEVFESSGIKDRIAAGELDKEVIHEADIIHDEPKNTLTN